MDTRTETTGGTGDRDRTIDHDRTTDGDRTADRDGGVTRRRAIAAAGGAIGIAGLAGCTALDIVTGGGPVEFAATAATVSEAALEETGYESNGVSDDVVSREVEAAGQTREVEVTNRIAEYDRAVEMLGQESRASVFTVLSTPQVKVLGRTFNPIGDMGPDELAELIRDRYDGLRNIERTDEYATGLFGGETPVVEYDAEADLAGGEVTVDLALHVTEPVEVGDDFVVCIGAYPEAAGDRDTVIRLLNGTEHPGA